MIDRETAKEACICPVCEGYGGGDIPEGHEDDPACIGSCPECWCPGCHDGQDFPHNLRGQVEGGDPVGSWLAFLVVQRHERERRQVEQGQGQLLGGST